MSDIEKKAAYKVTFQDKNVKVIEYTFDKISEAILFQCGMIKKGYEPHLTRVLI